MNDLGWRATLTTKSHLMLGDCLDRMREIPDASVDMVLADLPYGTTQNKWDSVIPPEPLWHEYWRICKGAVVLTATQPFSSALVMSQPSAFRHEWVWEKNKATGHLNASRAPLRAHEVALVFAQKAPSYTPQMTVGHPPANSVPRRGHNSPNYGQQKPSAAYGGATTRYPRSVLQFPIVNNNDPEKVHPTQKPVALFEYLIRTYTNPGDLVLDNTMGSGTTGVACVNTGRRFIGIERDPGYFEIAEKRIRAAEVSLLSPVGVFA